MSADRWAICPKCCRVLGNTFTDNELEELEGYNLREDYEVWTNVSGIFEIIYRCECYKCGFKFKYNYEQHVLELLDAAPK
jgi:hypothetical protein